MGVTQTTQIIDDGAVIRLEKDGKTVLIVKSQVRTIDTVHGNIVSIDMGEGPLMKILLNYLEVISPVVASAEELREAIKTMLYTNQSGGGDTQESTQVDILNQLGTIRDILLTTQQLETDFTKSEPTRIDETNPDLIYRGWHRVHGDPSQPEWAIERIRREGDITIREWALGSKQQPCSWDSRELYTYIPYDYDPRNG